MQPVPVPPVLGTMSALAPSPPPLYFASGADGLAWLDETDRKDTRQHGRRF